MDGPLSALAFANCEGGKNKNCIDCIIHESLHVSALIKVEKAITCDF